MQDIDVSQPPFSLLDQEGRKRLQRGLVRADYPSGSLILDAGQRGEAVFIIEQGEVAEVDPTLPPASARIGHYTAGDLFGAISIINGHSRYRFICEQTSRCLLLPGTLFEALCADYPAFDAFFRQSLAHKARLLTERRAGGGVTMAGFMLARVSDCMRPAHIVADDTDISGAVDVLNARQADSVLVRRAHEVGMVTKTDLLNALVVSEQSQATRVVDIAHFHLITATPDQYLFEALVAMTRHDVSRVVVVKQAEVVGVVELMDVLSYFSSRSYVVSLQVEQANDLASLANASQRTPELVNALMAQGVKLRFAMDLLAALNGRIISKAWQFTIDARYHDRSCLLVMGSEGRGEQILKTDQDNALILDESVEWQGLDTDMQTLTNTLVQLGYPPCPGNIMVSNPDWVGRVSDWQQRIAHWARRRDGDSLMKLAILLDSHPVAGNARLHEAVRDSLFEALAGDELLLSYLARAVLRFSTPLTLFGSLKKPQHGIDIKKGGIFPIVHGVRTMALERRISATSTFERLDALVTDGRLKRRFADDLGEALVLFTELRLKGQLAQFNEASSQPSNRVIVQQLSSLERDLLREALHIVKDFKQRLSHRYHLEYA